MNQSFEKAERIRACKNRRHVTLVTAYDYPTGRLLDEAGVDIVSELYWGDEGEHMLKSINGVAAGMNSSFKDSTRGILYNWLKYRFLTDEKFSKFVAHENFEKYIVNKIDKMILMRK